MPSISEAAAAIRMGQGVASMSVKSPPKTKLMERPATIQPRVPNTRMAGNSASGFSILLKAMALTSASVGM